MIEIINIKPSPVTPDKIIDIEINYNGKIYKGLLIKEDKLNEVEIC